MSTKRGIYLVANLKSQQLCENLIYSIRQSGCTLPIKLIHYGGDPVDSAYIKSQAELVTTADFPEEGLSLINRLCTVLTDCPRGFLNRFLSWYGEWDEFIYSDNDIVALMNWEHLFDYLPGNYLVHADEEYRTKGQFNYENPQQLEKLFGPGSLERAFTAGHYVSVKNSTVILDIERAIDWFQKNDGIPKRHDQTLLHVALLLGNWNVVNLCKDPHNWLTTWAGYYNNSLHLIQYIQSSHRNQNISHLHYSGRNADGSKAIDELLLSNLTQTSRLNRMLSASLQNIIKLNYLSNQRKRIKRGINKLFR